MYSSIPSGEKEKIDISVCFLFFTGAVLTWKHIRKAKEEKTHAAREVFLESKKNYHAEIKYKMSHSECAL